MFPSPSRLAGLSRLVEELNASVRKTESPEDAWEKFWRGIRVGLDAKYRDGWKVREPAPPRGVRR